MWWILPLSLPLQRSEIKKDSDDTNNCKGNYRLHKAIHNEIQDNKCSKWYLNKVNSCKIAEVEGGSYFKMQILSQYIMNN